MHKPPDDTGLLTKEEMRLYRRALRNGWPVSQEVRDRVVSRLCQVLESTNEVRVLGAAKTLVQADMVNVRREANELTERSVEVQQATAQLRAALALPGAAEALQALTDQMFAQLPHDDQPTDPAPQTQDQPPPKE